MKSTHLHLPRLSRSRVAWSVLLMAAPFVGNLGAVDPAPATPTAGVIAACTVTVPTGDYALVTLDFSVKGAPKRYETWTYMGGIRGGRMRMDDGIGLREPGGLLELKDGKLSGTFLRKNSMSVFVSDLDPAQPVQVTVDAVVKDGLISGSAEIAGVKGTVSGRMVGEADLAKGNAVAKDKSWPASQGPQAGGCSAQWTGVATINDLSGLRLQWRCEEGDIGNGPGSITRSMNYWQDATSRRAGSGAAGPIAADGRIFLSYTVPAVRDSKTPEVKGGVYGGTETELAAAMLAQAKKAGYTGSELPGYAVEKIFQSADDVVLCMDAATGKTLWKAVMKNRAINLQHHKAGPYGMTPAYGKGKVFALGMSTWLYAFEAETGKPLWEVKSEDYSLALLPPLPRRTRHAAIDLARRGVWSRSRTATKGSRSSTSGLILASYKGANTEQKTRAGRDRVCDPWVSDNRNQPRYEHVFALVCFGMNPMWHGHLARVKTESWARRPCHISSQSRQERTSFPQGVNP